MHIFLLLDPGVLTWFKDTIFKSICQTVSLNQIITIKKIKQQSILSPPYLGFNKPNFIVTIFLLPHSGALSWLYFNIFTTLCQVVFINHFFKISNSFFSCSDDIQPCSSPDLRPDSKDSISFIVAFTRS